MRAATVVTCARHTAAATCPTSASAPAPSGSSSAARPASPNGPGRTWDGLQRAQRLGDRTASGIAVPARGEELQQLVLAAFLTVCQAPHRQKSHEVAKGQDGEGGPLECQHRNPLGVQLPDGRLAVVHVRRRGVAATMTRTI